MHKEIITTTIRLHWALWAKLKQLIINGKIKSIHQAVLDGLEKIVKEKEK